MPPMAFNSSPTWRRSLSPPWPCPSKRHISGLWSANPRPFTVETIIYLMKWLYSEADIVHEATHVWQYIHGGGDYEIHSV